MKILHITYGFNGGGVGFVISNYCTGESFQDFQFDIVGEDTGKRQLLHDRFEKAGFHVFYVTPKKLNLIKNIREMFRIMKNGNYDAVHVHFEEWSFLYLWIAKICGVPERICHAHMAYMVGERKKPHYKLFRILLNHFATLRLACSKDAGDHLYGNNPFVIIHNAINLAEYTFSEEKRTMKRRELGVGNCFVMGTVGRLSFQKNPELTVEIFNEVKRRKNDSKLLFVGQGELEAIVRKKVAALGLSDSVLFLGLRNDVPELLQAMDVFVLPSRFEGLGIVYVEAQAAGLKTFATANVVPQEACISKDLFTYVSQSELPAGWADKILSVDTRDRMDTSKLIQSCGYDISIERIKLFQTYMASIGEKNENHRH